MKNLAILLVLTLKLFAHPHYFIDVDLNITDKNISHYWSFDKINSRLLLFDFDKNGNKKFDKEETIAFYQSQIENLKKNNFHLFVEENGEEKNFLKLDDFKIEYLKRRVVLSFNTKLSSLSSGTICTIDPTVYMAFKLNTIKSSFKQEIQKSDYDFCIGVSK